MESEFKKKNVRHKFFNALYGALLPYQTEISIRIQTFFVVAAILLGVYFHISSIDWMFIVTAAGVLLITETLNTALEKLVDLVSPGYHELAGKVKDLAAGAVFMAAIISIIIALLVFVPYLK